MKKYRLNTKQKDFLSEKVLTSDLSDDNLIFYTVQDLKKTLENGYYENDTFILKLDDEMGLDFENACRNAFSAIGRKEDDEPNEDGYFAEELGDYFFDIAEGEK